MAIKISGSTIIDDSRVVVNADKIKKKGIEKIFCLSVNDPFVMNAWGEANNAGGKITMLSDCLLYTSPSPRDRG